MSKYELLDPYEEDLLHKSRLLAVEEKPYKRITKRLLTPGSLISAPTSLPSIDAKTDTKLRAQILEEKAKQLEERRQFRDDVILDFATFDLSIARIQFLHKSNEEDRKRYATEKERIIQAAQEVRDDAVQLRVQLETARQTLAQRKQFDELAEKITNNRLLRPREDQEINLVKLEEECTELEKETQTYAVTWKERKEQFQRIVEEGMQLRRLIRDEKEEVERREGMVDGGEEDGEVGEGGSRGGTTPKYQVNTPRPEDGSTPVPLSKSPSQEGLKPQGSRLGVGSRAPSPAASDRRKTEEDVEMGEADGNPKVTVDGPVDATAGQDENEDKMDTT